MSVEIINKGGDKKPPLTFTGHPSFTSTTDHSRYWEREYERWINGYAGLTGRHYFYLTMGHLKPVAGMPIRPQYRDGDQEVFEEDALARKFGLTLGIIKRREFGLTSIFGGMEPIYNCLTLPGSINLITSADKTRVKNLFSDKTMFFFDHLELPEHMMPKKKSERQEGFLNLGQKKGGVGSGSQVYCLETADNDKNAKRFETFRAMSIFLDELFLHPRADIVFKSSQACLRQGFETIGHMTIGGSCGGETETEVQALKKNASLVEGLIHDAESLDLRFFFIEGWKCINGADELDDDGKKTGNRLSFMKNGYSDKEAAISWILKKRAVFERAKDKSHFYNFVKSYPLTIDEVFEINRMGIMPPEVYASLEVAKKNYYLGSGSKTMSLRRDSRSGKLEASLSTKGPYVVAREPELGKTYISGTDPIPFGENSISEGSDYTNIIYCLEDEMAVAYYAERNLDPDVVVSAAILLQEWYASEAFPFGAPSMVESNRGEVAMRKYEALEKKHLLAPRPKNLGIIYEESIKDKRGWYSNDKTISRANSYMVENLKKYADRIELLRLIEEAAVFPNGNLDLLDAFKSALIYLADYRNGLKKMNKVGVVHRAVPYYTRENGRVVQKWKNSNNDDGRSGRY